MKSVATNNPKSGILRHRLSQCRQKEPQRLWADRTLTILSIYLLMKAKFFAHIILVDCMLMLGCLETTSATSVLSFKIWDFAHAQLWEGGTFRLPPPPLSKKKCIYRKLLLRKTVGIRSVTGWVWWLVVEALLTSSFTTMSLSSKLMCHNNR